jgi:hypothetical protein
MDRVIIVKRSATLNQLAGEIASLPVEPYLRVAVDGFDGSAKPQGRSTEK